jgi:hypothetical protein
MKNILITSVFLMCFNTLYSQSVYNTIDTSNIEIAKRIDFIRRYYNCETNENAKKFWNPKLINVKHYNFGTGIEAISRNNTPKEIKKLFKLQISELEMLNDSLAYVKIEVVYPEDGHILTYKYYIGGNKEQYYLDNAISYEKSRFKQYKTNNVNFYISPFRNFSTKELNETSKSIDDLYSILKTRKKRSVIDVYLCSNIEEMNIVANMSKYYGRQGGFSNSESNFTAYMYQSPKHLHEFVHVIMGGNKEQNSILEEGIASYYGGLNPNQTLSYGKTLVKNCLKNDGCKIEDLMYNRKNLVLNYSVWAAICEYIIIKLGEKSLFNLFYDEDVNDKNLLDVLSNQLNTPKEMILSDIQKMFLSGDK